MAAIRPRRARAARGRLDRRRRRRGRSRRSGGSERRRDAQRSRPRRACRLLLDRLRLRRDDARAVHRVGRAEAALRLRTDEARGRARGARRLDRPQFVAVRLDGPQLRQDDARARPRARRGRRRRRPNRLANVRRPPRRGDARPARAPARHLAPRRRGPVLLGRVRPRDLRRGRARDASKRDHDRRARPPRPTSRVLGVAERAPRSAAPTTLARRPPRLLRSRALPGGRHTTTKTFTRTELARHVRRGNS